MNKQYTEYPNAFCTPYMSIILQGATFDEEPIAQDPELDGTDEENPEKRHGRSNIKPKRNLEEDARMDYLRKVLF